MVWASVVWASVVWASVVWASVVWIGQHDAVRGKSHDGVDVTCLGVWRLSRFYQLLSQRRSVNSRSVWFVGLS